MIIDTHCHYNLEPLFSNNTWEEIEPQVVDEATSSQDLPSHTLRQTSDGRWQKPQLAWKEHWQKAQDSGVIGSVIIGTNFHTSSIAVDLCTHVPSWRAAIGIHPTAYEATDSEETVSDNLDELQLIAGDKRIVAIGETGLDYYHMKREGAAASDISKVKNLQKESFQSHMRLAQEKSLPLIIHVRDTEEEAYSDVLELLRQNRQSDQPFILHCVSGPAKYISQAVEMGGYIGVAGNVTYPSADNIRSLVRAVPTDRILLETDAPFLPPQQNRGKNCEPWMISQTAEYVSQLLGVEPEQFVDNAQRALKI